MGNPDIRTYFEQVDVEAALKTAEPDDGLEESKRAVDQRCPAYGMFRAAKVETIDNWVKA